MTVSLILSGLLAFGAATTPQTPSETVITASHADAPTSRVEFRIRNNTGSSVRIHTGRGTSTIGNGSSNRYQADVGQEFRLDRSSGPLLFEVSSDMDGETLDLADFM
jgi:hypothetical protein